MASLGALLIVLGLGSLLLPVFNIQFRLMEILEDYQPYAGIAVAAIGAIILFVAAGRGRRTVTTTSTDHDHS
jgi:hypothetical protein